jgi:ParB family chromosome partitioning protein
MSKAKNVKPATVSAGGTEQFIPLNRLKKSPRNARQMPHPQADIEALAASIAVHGMLQAPVVEPEIKNDKPTGHYLVTIGEGRRQAQLLRAKRKEIAKNEPIRCTVETAHDAFEISLAENAIRSPMHPADQFDAFYRLSTEQGLSVEDIAARFGITPAVVKQRLKLATVSPLLIRAYRKRELTLDQLTAFAITDDHKRQEHVFVIMHPNTDREDILAALNEDHVPASDPRAVFVGKEAYQAAGGALRADLFDEENGGYFTDADLLFDLAAKKLEAAAETVRSEGWKWVEAMPRYDYSAVSEFRRVYPGERSLTDAEAEQLEALEEQYAALEVEEDDEEASAEAERLNAAIEALRGEDVFDADTIARGGAVVTLAHDGSLRIERGFIRREDDVRHAKEAKPGKADGAAALPEKLIVELTASRTSALRNQLAQHADAALLALLHNLVEQAFYGFHGEASCLTIRTSVTVLDRLVPAIAESEAGKAIASRHEGWAKRLPDGVDELWTILGTLEMPERMELLAHCVSLTLDCVQQRGFPAKPVVHEIAAAIGFDMAAHWQPTPQNYLGRVSKDRILEAVREGVSKDAADNLAGLKKAAMADAAAERLAGKRWLPSVLRSPSAVTDAAEAA